MSITIIVANDKGGVGKSTVAQFCAVEMKRRFGTVHVVEYDGQHRLKRFFAEAEVTSVAVEGRTSETEPREAIWDPMLEWLDDTRPTVVDFGAQMWDAFLGWAEVTMPADIIDTGRTIVLVPFTADLEAVAGAQRVAEGIGRALPGARLVALACDKDGDTAMLTTTPPYLALKRAVAEAGGDIRAFPVMAREGYPVLAALGVRFDRIVEARPKALAASSGLPAALAARTISSVRAWSEAAARALDDLFAVAAEPIAAEPPPAMPPAAEAFPADSPVELAAAKTVPSPVPPITPARPMVFDEDAYRALYPDVAQAVEQGLFASGYQHYLERGMREGRSAPTRPA